MAATITLRPERLTELRTEAGLTTDNALAIAAGIAPGNLSRILNGHQTPGHRAIAGLCNALNASMDDLFTIAEAAA